MKPGFGLTELRKKDKPEEFEKFVWTDKVLFKYDRHQKTVVTFPGLPSPSGLGWPFKGILDSLETGKMFLLGKNLEEARRRFEFQLAKEDEWYVYLDVKPRTREDEATFLRIRVVLHKDNYLPRQVWFEEPNRNTVTWDILRIDTTVPLKQEQFENPSLPPGWSMKMMFAGSSAVGPTNKEEEPDRKLGPKTTGRATVSRDCFDLLVEEVVSSQHSNEQAAEALCLATLARYPTETEKKFIVDCLAAHKDRREALAHVLEQLIQSKEFDAHLEMLNQRKARR
jgi:hypothetical protein